MKTNFDTIYSDVITLLNSQLPKYLLYHDTEHTLYVLDRTVYIAKKEKVNSRDLELIKLAALYHDIGFITTVEGHEEESCKMAKKNLKAYGYSKSDIDIVCETIMATKIPQKPTNELGKILADADLEYLATKHFESISELLYKELKHFNPKLTKKEWNNIQIDFIENHRYHTTYCKHYKSFRKLKNLKQLKSKT